MSCNFSFSLCSVDCDALCIKYCVNFPIIVIMWHEAYNNDCSLLTQPSEALIYPPHIQQQEKTCFRLLAV